jgi:hypothetical protein
VIRPFLPPIMIERGGQLTHKLALSVGGVVEAARLQAGVPHAEGRRCAGADERGCGHRTG